MSAFQMLPVSKKSDLDPRSAALLMGSFAVESIHEHYWVILKHIDTVTTWIPDKSGIKMVQTCPFCKWSGFWMVVWIQDKKVCFYGLKCPVFKWPFENWTKQGPKSQLFEFRVFGIQMVSVLIKALANRDEIPQFQSSKLKSLIGIFPLNYKKKTVSRPVEQVHF